MNIEKIIKRRKKRVDGLSDERKKKFINQLLNDNDPLYRLEVATKLGVTANQLRLFRVRDLKKLDKMHVER